MPRFVALFCVQGDVSRAFLGKKPLPYKQAFRVELVRSGKQEEMFDFDRLYVSLLAPTIGHALYDCVFPQVQTGTMAGFSYGDTLEVYHVLCPWLRVKGTVTKAQALNCLVTIQQEDDRTNLSKAVQDIYQVIEELVQWLGYTSFLSSNLYLAVYLQMETDPGNRMPLHSNA